MRENEQAWRRLQAEIKAIAEAFAEAIDACFAPGGSGEPSKDPKVMSLSTRLNELKRLLG